MSKKPEDVRFGKFGTVSFTKTTRVNDFIDHLENGKVMYTHCKTCGANFSPPGGLQWMSFQRHGMAGGLRQRKAGFLSQLKYAPVGFDADLPYSIALLDYGDYQVFGRLDSNLDINDVKIGMQMTTAVNELPNGQLNYIFKKA